MRAYLVGAVFVVVACLYADSAAELVELGNAAEQETYSPDECSSVRESLPSLCKMFGAAQCSAMKEKLHRSCHEEKVAPKAAATTQEQDLGEDDGIGESVGRRGGALMTSGSFTMSSASNRAGNSEELGEDEDEQEQEYSKELMPDKCPGEQTWMRMDAEDPSVGKCVEFAADEKCVPQCFSKGKQSTEEDNGAVCSKICRLPGSNGAKCNVVKMVKPIQKDGKQLFLTVSNVKQANLKNLAAADPMACAGITGRR